MFSEKLYLVVECKGISEIEECPQITTEKPRKVGYKPHFSIGMDALYSAAGAYKELGKQANHAYLKEIKPELISVTLSRPIFMLNCVLKGLVLYTILFIRQKLAMSVVYFILTYSTR